MLEQAMPDLFSISYRLRQDWLKFIFGQRIKFIHRKQEYYYVPTNMAGQSSAITGMIGRQTKVEENQPPDLDFEKIERDSWQASTIAIDPYHHDDGQRLVMEVNNQVGRPKNVLRSLCLAINSFIPSNQYYIDINEITRPSDFWHFVEQNPNNITSVTFYFIAPNMFGGAGRLREILRDLRDKERSQKTIVRLSNPKGLVVERKRFEGPIKVAMTEGSGSVTARTNDGLHFNSANNIMTVSIDEESDRGVPSDEKSSEYALVALKTRNESDSEEDMQPTNDISDEFPNPS